MKAVSYTHLDVYKRQADIGCDHGFVTAALIEDYGAKQVIACDISEKSLQKAKKLVCEHNLVQSVDFYVADGLSALTDKSPDCVIIAGMGGLLIRDILERDIKTAKRAQKLVLAPQGNEYELRTFLYENDFMIYDEAIVYDEGKYYQVIDVYKRQVLTTREIAQMIKEAGIDFVNLPDEDFDEVLGTSTGAGVIFGATGGVMEAALRTVAEVLTGKELENIDFCDVRGITGIKLSLIHI